MAPAFADFTRLPGCEQGVTTIEVAEHALEALFDGINLTVDALQLTPGIT